MSRGKKDPEANPPYPIFASNMLRTACDIEVLVDPVTEANLRTVQDAKMVLYGGAVEVVEKGKARIRLCFKNRVDVEVGNWDAAAGAGDGAGAGKSKG